MLLAIDTASAWMSAALYDGQQLLAESSLYTRNHHTQQLSPLLAALLERAGQQPQSLSALAISQGPGSFSGLRVGFGVAKGLALAHQLPLIAIPTLNIIAAASPYFHGRLIACVQAGRGRIIAEHFSWLGKQWQPDGDATISTWAACLEGLAAPVLINGEIDASGREAIQQQPLAHMLPAPWQLRRAGFLAHLAWEQWQQGAVVSDPAAVNPLYLKEPG